MGCESVARNLFRPFVVDTRMRKRGDFDVVGDGKNGGTWQPAGVAMEIELAFLIIGYE